MRTTENSPKIEELEDKVQSESIAKNELVKNSLLIIMTFHLQTLK